MPITIRLKRNGPYIIAAEEAADVRIVDADGRTLVPEPGRIVLCRCGGSSTKPFCDGTHKRNGFDGTPNVDADHSTPDPGMGDGSRPGVAPR